MICINSCLNFYLKKFIFFIDDSDLNMYDVQQVLYSFAGIKFIKLIRIYIKLVNKEVPS